MKKKLIAITLLTLCGGITAAGATSLVKYENHPIEVKAGVIETIAGSMAMTYEDQLENKYATEYKINYPEIEEYLTGVITFLHECSRDNITRDELEAYLEEVDAKLATYKNDTDELSALKNGLENFISTIDKNEASDTTLINFKNKFLRVSAVFGEETPDEINNLMHYAETGYNAITIISKYVEDYSRFLSENDLNSLTTILNNLIQNLRNKEENVDSFCELAISNSKEIILPVKDVADEYNSAKQIINEKYAAASEYINFSTFSLIVFEQFLSDTLEELELAATVEEISDIIFSFDENLSYLIGQVEVAKEYMTHYDELCSFDLMSDYKEACNTCNKILEGNPDAEYFLGPYIEALRAANGNIETYDKYLNMFIEVQDFLPDEVKNNIIGTFIGLESYLQYSLSASKYHFEDEIEDWLDGLFSTNELITYFTAYADSSFKEEYSLYAGNGYTEAFNKLVNDIIDEMRTMSYLEIAKKLNDYMTQLNNINTEASYVYQFGSYEKKLETYTSLDALREALSEVDEFLNAHPIVHDMLGSGIEPVVFAHQIIDAWDSTLAKYNSVKHLLPAELCENIEEEFQNIETYMNNFYSLSSASDFVSTLLEKLSYVVTPDYLYSCLVEYVDTFYDYHIFNQFDIESLYESALNKVKDEFSGLTYEQAAEKVSGYINEISKINAAGRTAYELLSNYDGFSNFIDYSSYKENYDEVNTAIKENSYVETLLGMNFIGPYYEAGNFVVVFENFYAKYNEIREQLPEIVQNLIENEVKKVEKYLSENLNFGSLYSAELVNNVDRQLNNFFDNNFLLNSFNSIAFSTIYNEEYYNALGEVYSVKFQEYLSSCWAPIVTNTYADAANMFEDLLDEVRAYNDTFANIIDFKNIVDRLKNFEYTEGYKYLLEEVKETYDSFSNDQKQIVSNIYYIVTCAEEIYNFFDELYELIDTKKESFTDENTRYINNFMQGAKNNFRKHFSDGVTSFDAFYEKYRSELNEYLATIKDINEAKANAIEHINYLSSTNDLLKNDPNIDTLVEDWIAAVNNATTLDEVEEAGQQIDIYLSFLELNQQKEELKQYLTNYYESLNKSEWSEKNISTQDELLENYLEKIDNAKTKSELNKIKKEALAKLGRVAVIEKHTRKGCGSSIIATSALVTLMSGLGVALILSKKREENKNN